MFNPYNAATEAQCLAEMVAFISASLPVPEALLERLDEYATCTSDTPND